MKKLLLMVLGVTFGLSSVTIGAADEKKPEKKAPEPEAVFKRLDKDSNGKLTKDEFLASRKTDEAKQKGATQFDRKDADKDGSLSLEEFKAMPGKKKPA
jgi:Ca2+-binding EF-hand superfamily protein